MDFKVGATSSLIACSIVYPIDVIKVQYQCQINSNGVNIGIINTIKYVYNKNGLRGFYKGFAMTSLTYPIFWGMYFQTGNLFRHEYCPFDDNQIILKSMISSFMASLVSNPFFTIKVRTQTQILKNRETPYFQLIRNMYKNEGIRSFFKGFPIVAISNLKLIIQMSLVTKCEASMSNNNDTIGYKCLKVSSGAAASKLLVSLVSYPSDLIRNVQRDAEHRLSIINLARQIYNKTGILGFYRGIGLYTLITLPNFVIMMTLRPILEQFL